MGFAPVFENFSENSLMGDLSNDTNDNPPLFSLIIFFYPQILLQIKFVSAVNFFLLQEIVTGAPPA